MRETGESISEWAVETFGEAGNDCEVAERAIKEVAELVGKLASHDGDDIVEECADITICLARLAHRNGGDIFEAVDAKMSINRDREWVVDEKGFGQHVPE